MSFTTYLSPRAIWDRLVGRPPTTEEVAERFEDRYRDTPGRHMGRTADTVEAGGSSSGSSEVLAHRVEGPATGPPAVTHTPWEPRSLVTRCWRCNGSRVTGVDGLVAVNIFCCTTIFSGNIGW